MAKIRSLIETGKYISQLEQQVKTLTKLCNEQREHIETLDDCILHMYNVRRKFE